MERGETRKGHQGWVAWIDDESREVHVAEAECIRFSGDGKPVVETIDGEHQLTVPHGRLQWSPAAACDQLAYDVRIEGERHIEPHQTAIARLARQMLLDLVAIEMAKAKSGGKPGGLLEEGIKQLPYQPKRIEGKS